MASKIRFSGYVSIYQEFVEKKKKRVFRFFGGWVWSEGKKKRQARADCV
jgi:hypothetical protein